MLTEAADRLQHLVDSYNSGAYRDSEAVENLAETMQLLEETLPRAEKIERALRVMVTDKFIRTFLSVMDPKALEQAEVALADTGPTDNTDH